MSSDGVRCGPMGSDTVISHTPDVHCFLDRSTDIIVAFAYCCTYMEALCRRVRAPSVRDSVLCSMSQAAGMLTKSGHRPPAKAYTSLKCILVLCIHI